MVWVRMVRTQSDIFRVKKGYGGKKRCMLRGSVILYYRRDRCRLQRWQVMKLVVKVGIVIL